jgi:ketosteroid isomerase-like protein
MRYVIGFLVLLNSFALPGQSILNDDSKIKQVNQKYVEYWLRNEQDSLLALFENDATLSPNTLKPVTGIRAIREFWFPNDSSSTTLHQFTSDLKDITVIDQIAHSTQETFLSWTYKKGSTIIRRDQWGIALTVYKRRANGSWRIWRQLWTDIKSVDRK